MAFYDAELPAAGFQITDASGSSDFCTIELLDPEGHEGSLRMWMAAAPHAAQMSIEIWLNRVIGSMPFAGE